MKTVCSFFFLFSFIAAVDAATCTFTNGGGNNLWSNPANWNNGIVPDGDDDAIISAGTLNVDFDITVNSLTISSSAVVNFTHSGTAYIGDLAMSGGSIDSNNKIIITNSFIWNGTSSLTTSSSLELSATCTTTISGSGNRNLYGALVNNGTCNHTGGSLRLQVGGSVENNGTFTINGATFIINVGGNAFTNNGVFNKNNSNELNFFASFDQAGTGIANINAGTMKLLFGGTSKADAAINIASGATLSISSGTYSFGADNSISGAGDFEVLGGTITVDATFNVTGNTEISGGTINFNHATASNFTNLNLSGGTLQGNGQLVINSDFRWSGTSTIQGGDSLKLTNTANGFIFGGGSKGLYKPIINDGYISHTAGNLRFYTGASFENNGIYAVNGPSKIFDDGGGSFDNNGTFDHQKNSNFNFDPDFNNNLDGIIKGQGNIDFTNLNNLGIFAADVAYGTLELKNPLAVGNGISVEFDNADHGGISVKGDVTLSGTLNVNMTGTVPVGTYTILSASSGTISGTFDTENIPGEFAIQYSSTAVSLEVSVLPVEITKFTIVKQPKDILLEWQTATEINSDRFVIEHSSDGQGFSSIGEVKAAGFSNAIQNYRFVDEMPTNGNNYYRLRQIDRDGSFEYSDLRAMLFYNFDKDLSIYPNPTMGNIIVKNQSDKAFKVTITDLSGKTVYVRNGVTPGATMIDLSNLPKSMYTLEITDDGFYSYKEKLMILE